MALLFGIIEFSWIFNQVLDVRHGSREGARLVAVNYQAGPSPTAQTAAIIATICARVDEPSKVRVTITLETAGADEPGDVAFVRVERDLEQLTGFFDVFLRNVQPNAETAFLLEQNATWSPSLGETACP